MVNCVESLCQANKHRTSDFALIHIHEDLVGEIGYSRLLGILVVVPSSLNPDPLSDQKGHFDTRFQTRPVKSIPVFRPCL